MNAASFITHPSSFIISMEGVTTVRATAPGEAVIELPWLCPGADALAALARTPVPWATVRTDPGAVLLVVRHSNAFSNPSRPPSPEEFLEPSLIQAALRGLKEHADVGFVDWRGDGAHEIYGTALECARLARRVAEWTSRAPPEHAWVGGLLAPLGWLAVCAANPAHARDCLADPGHARHPAVVERRHWGLDQAALARRLARRWGLPPWLAAVVGYLGLPPEDARRCGGSAELFAAVRLGVTLAQRRGGSLRLCAPAARDESAAALGLTPAALDELESAPPGEGHEPRLPSVRCPGEVPLLTDLLTLAGENRRLRDVPTQRRGESEVDALAEALRETRAGEAERLRAQKLASLAELAAGAGHEINNPLAVISGQAQFLLSKLRAPKPRVLSPSDGTANGEKGAEHADTAQSPACPAALADAEPALRKIVEQAQRIHQILRELMQFARPPLPRKEAFDAGELVQEVAASLAELAAQRRVRMVVARPERPVSLCADPGQVRTALACLLRNAIEAAPADGWAGLRLETHSPDAVEVVVEDNGPGPPPQQREHLFDPFYCGRSAGRGRGLGLPTAWRLARQHGGDVQFVSLPGGPTRFVFTLPIEPPPVPTSDGHGQS
jgi:signal transduction histidine kinase